MDNQLQTTDPAPAATKPIKLKPKQRRTLEIYLDPDHEYFGNLYKSCLEAGFSNSYALNVTHLRPLWLSDNIGRQELLAEHIKQGVQKIATGVIDSRSVDDTRLKAYEMLGNWSGMNPQNKGTINNILVQPILNGQSVKQPIKVDVEPPIDLP